MASKPASLPEYLSSFGRNRGRSLRPYQQKLVDELLPKLHCHPEAASKEIVKILRLAPQAPLSPIALEIGFGAGEHLLAQARHQPDTLWIGCEPFINGVAKCLAGVDRDGLSNIRLYTRDARELIDALPDACIDSAFILFPDPWPKLRHQKRRLVNHDTLARLARIHKPGGRLLLATDHEDYALWMFEHLRATPHYQWLGECRADWQTPPADWTETKYQRKTSAEGRPPVFLECSRRPA